jgi:hypothetical protein
MNLNIKSKSTDLDWFEHLRGKGARGDLLDKALQFSIARMDDPGGGERDADDNGGRQQQRQHPAAPHFFLLVARRGANYRGGMGGRSRQFIAPPGGICNRKEVFAQHTVPAKGALSWGPRAQEAAIRLSGLRLLALFFFFACGARAACGGTKLCPFTLQLPPAAAVAAHKTRNLCAAFCFP